MLTSRLIRYITCMPGTIMNISMSTHARPISGAFLISLPWTFRLLNLLIFINFINIMLPMGYVDLHNSIYVHVYS